VEFASISKSGTFYVYDLINTGLKPFNMSFHDEQIIFNRKIPRMFVERFEMFRRKNVSKSK
jgi:hypothetical protein